MDAQMDAQIHGVTFRYPMNQWFINASSADDFLARADVTDLVDYLERCTPNNDDTLESGCN